MPKIKSIRNQGRMCRLYQIHAAVGIYSFTAVLMWYQQTYQVTNYVLQKRVFEKGASGD